MTRHLTPRPGSVVLYDVGGAFLMLLFFGIPLGSIFDFLWNLFVLSVALPLLPGTHVKIGRWRTIVFCLFITMLGLLIDFAYFELTWDAVFGKTAMWAPTMPQWLQFVWLLLPMSLIFLVNAAISYAFFKLERRQAVTFGLIMGFFTAPWLLPTAPYVLGWVV